MTADALRSGTELVASDDADRLDSVLSGAIARVRTLVVADLVS